MFRFYRRNMFIVNVLTTAVILLGVVVWGTVWVWQNGSNCTVTVNMHTVTLHPGQLISTNTAQVLCDTNGQLDIETR